MIDLRLVLALAGLAALAYFVRQAAGRLAPKVAIAPIVFLTTRWPVLAATLVGTGGWLFVLTQGMREKGLDTPANLAVAMLVALLAGSGVAVMVVLPIFLVARAFAKVPELPLEPGEAVLLRRPANHFLRGESRGGELFLTTRRLAFRPHRFNVQLTPWSAPLEAFDRLEPEGLRMVVAHLHTGADEWLVVPQPNLVADLVQRVARTPEAERATVPVAKPR